MELFAFSALSLDQLDPYNHAFVETVLKLQGVAESPTLEQFSAAMQTLSAFYLELAAAMDRGDKLNEDWLEGKDPSEAGQEDAFYFVSFGTAILPSDEQVHAFHRWTGAPAQLLN
jgi:hypothetical protein